MTTVATFMVIVINAAIQAGAGVPWFVVLAYALASVAAVWLNSKREQLPVVRVSRA